MLNLRETRLVTQVIYKQWLPAIVEVRYGKGRIILLGFRVQQRGQPHGTVALLFNAILCSALEGP